jgi:hypothetical protein
MAQNINLIVYEFNTINHLKFNYKIYSRDVTKSYRQGERQYLPGDLYLWPNTPPVDINHLSYSSGTDIQSPFTVSFNEDDSYYILVWKDNYSTDERRFYVPSPTFHNPDGSFIGNFPSDLYFQISPVATTAADNARIFV